MAPTFPISSAQAADFERIRKSSPSLINKVDQAIRSARAPIVRATQLTDLARKAIPDPGLAEAIVREGIYLASFVRRTNQDEAEIIAGLAQSLARRPEWDGARIREFQDHLDALKTLVENDNIYLSAKAIDLSFDSDRVLTGYRVITDVRPVLSREHETAVGAVVIHNLRVSYIEHDRPAEISIALDEEDLRAIIKSSQEALTKTAAAKNAVSEKIEKSNIFVAGEEYYGFS